VRTWSLHSRIVWHTALALAMMVVVLGLFYNLMDTLEGFWAADKSLLPHIAASVQRDGAGQLRLAPTLELKKVEEKDSLGLWFIVLDRDGREVRYGQVPVDLEPVAARLPSTLGAYADGEVQRIEFEDERSGGEAELTAMAARLPSPAGEVRIMFGIRPQEGSFVIEVLDDLEVVFLPFLAFTLFTAFVSVPILVRRALRSLGRITEIAASIDVDRRGQRLPVENVPQEVLPLVEAVNAALARLDLGYTQQKRFLADAAHELRTPIAILHTNLEAMPTSRQQQKLLNDVGRLANTAEQLLDLHRMDYGIQSMEEVDLVNICQLAVGDLAPNAIAAGYELSFSADRKRIPVHGDAGALERVVSNLIRNAVEHGGGRGSIRVTAFHPNVIEVIDEGPGIPADQREEVFEPFYRVSPKPRGAGLGLNLVKQIVQRHGGEVSVIATDRGAHFRVIL
jgi:two-component system OmpR family sensor kinase